MKTIDQLNELKLQAVKIYRDYQSCTNIDKKVIIGKEYFATVAKMEELSWKLQIKK